MNIFIEQLEESSKENKSILIMGDANLCSNNIIINDNPKYFKSTSHFRFQLESDHKEK